MLIDMEYGEILKLKEQRKVDFKTFWYEDSFNYRPLFEEKEEEFFISFNNEKERFELYTKK